MTRARAQSVYRPDRPRRSAPRRRASMPSLRPGLRPDVSDFEGLQRLAGNRSVGQLLGAGPASSDDSLALEQTPLAIPPPTRSIRLDEDEDEDEDGRSSIERGGVVSRAARLRAGPAPVQAKSLFPGDLTTGPSGMKYASAGSIDEAYSNILGFTTKTFDQAGIEITDLDVETDEASTVMRTLREAAVKTTGKLDNHVSSLGGNKAFMAGVAHDAQSRPRVGPEAWKRYQDIDAWHARAGELADDAHALSQEIRAAEPDVVQRARAGRTSWRAHAARLVGKGRERMTSTDAPTAAAFKRRLFGALTHREEARRAVKFSKQSMDWARKNRLADDQMMKRAKFGLGKIKSSAVETMTLGLVGRKAELTEGGRQVDARLDILPMVDEFKRVRARAEAVRRSGAMGGETASAVYTVLQMTTQWLLPMLRTVTTGLSLWGIILAPFTVGASLALTAVCGSLTLALTALKAALDLALTVWTAGARMTHGNYDARKYRVAQVESVVAATDFASNAAYVATGAGFNSGAGGGWMSPTEALKARALDPTNTAQNRFGDAGWVHGSDWGWVDRPAMLRPVMIGAAKGTAVPLGFQGNQAGIAYRQDAVLGSGFKSSRVVMDGPRRAHREAPELLRYQRVGRTVSKWLSSAVDKATTLEPVAGGAAKFEAFDKNRLAVDVVRRESDEMLRLAGP